MAITAHKVGNKVVLAGVTAGLVYELTYVKTDIKKRKATKKGQISVAFSRESIPTSINVNGNPVTVSNIAPPTTKPTKTSTSSSKTSSRTTKTQKTSINFQANYPSTVVHYNPNDTQLRPVIW